MPVLPEYEKLEKRTSEERLALIKKWSTWFYDNTDTFEGELGMQLAYLWAAIANGNKIEAEENSAVMKTLNGCKVPLDEEIREYIDVVPDEEEV